jgi:hypothetical protein
MSLEVNQSLKDLRAIIYKDYEFWLGCYYDDKGEKQEGERWKSGLIHAYLNTLIEIDLIIDTSSQINKQKCPCHVCEAMRKDRTK